VVVAIMEILDPAVKTDREVYERLKIPIFGEIPRLTARPINRRRFWSLGPVPGT